MRPRDLNANDYYAARDAGKAPVRWLVIALGVLTAIAPLASAQDRPNRPLRKSDPQSQQHRPPLRDSEGRGGRQNPVKSLRLLDRISQDNPFRPSPQDIGPLEPGEEEDLLGFARARLPDIFGALSEIRSRNPEMFRNRMRDMLPRLRMLRRTFGENPQRAEWIVQYIQNTEKMQRMRRVWSQNKSNASAQQRARAEAQRLMAENMRIESRVMDDRAAELKHDRESLAEGEIDRLLSSDADMSAEPPVVAKMVGEIAAAENERQRAGLRDVLREMLLEKIDDRVDGLSHRAAAFRERAPAEIDARLDRLFSDTPDPQAPFATPPTDDRP